jgi:hypothetical protein
MKGTVGIGWAGGPPNNEKASKPSRCETCPKSGDYKLEYGSGKGKPGSTATDAEILDCLKEYPPKFRYDWISYNCKDWAMEAMMKCGLKCTQQPYPYDLDPPSSHHFWF